MTLTADQLGTLKAHVQETVGDVTQLKPPDGYKDSLALCIIDSIQSTGVRYTNVERVVGRYRTQRGAAARTDGVPDLLKTFNDLGTAADWAREIGTGHKTSTSRGAPLKAQAIHDAALALHGLAIDTTADLRRLVPEAPDYTTVKDVWLDVVGQRSGITWRYALMLAGVPGVKPDRMIRRFVGKALAKDWASPSTDFVAGAIQETADSLNVDASALDHAIWRYQRLQKKN